MSSSERLVVVGGIGLGAASLVPWYKPGEFAFNESRTNGWQDPDAFLSQAATVLGVGLAVVVLAVSRQSDRPTAGNLGWGTLITAWAAVVFGLVALKYSLNTDNTTVGIYLALTAAIVQLYGAYVTRIEDADSTPTGAYPVGPFPDTRPPPPTTWPTSSTPAQPGVPAPAPGTAAATPGAGVGYGETAGQRSVESGQAGQAGWVETVYFLAVWLPTGGSVEAVVAGYRRAFAGEPDRVGRLLAEVRALLDPARAAEREALLAHHAPQWVPVGADVVFTQLASTLGNT